ncbi:MAG: alpha-mannosidase [Parvibaculaceae bacterium]
MTEIRRIRGRYPAYTRARLKSFAARLNRAIYPARAAAQRIEMAGPVGRISWDEAQNLTYRDVSLGERLGPLWATYWFRVTFQVPQNFTGHAVDLHWDTRSEALVWIDGRSVAGFNPGRSAMHLIDKAQGDETISIMVEVACNRSLGAAEDLSQQRVREEAYELVGCELRLFDREAWDLFHDFDVLRQLEADREPKQEPRSFGGAALKTVRPALDTTWAGKLLNDLNRVCNELDPQKRDTWSKGREILDGLLHTRNGDVVHELSAIGHAHIDTAWLWPIEETHRKCQRSFSTVVTLMDQYPEFKFACSQAYQYDVIARLNPDLFARIKEKIANGQWIVIGGSWVEPDCNLPSGESLTRQFLYGQRYFEQTFGTRSTIFWNPDVFGYAGQLPQLMREAGLHRFLTQKLSWNKYTSPPHHSFHWRGLDGSSVLAHFPPADTYNGVTSVEELRYHAANYKDADRTSEALYLFGYGDGGGGPTAEMIETLRRSKDLLGLPRSVTRTPDEFFARLERDADNLATVDGELYFEYHRGTYTSQSEVKRLNRRAEGALQTLEFLSTSAMLSGAAHPDRDKLEELWKVLLVNQFHDILPGSSIGDVYERTRDELGKLVAETEALAEIVLGALTKTQGALCPVNTTGFSRAHVAEAPDGTLHYVTAAPFAAGQIGETEDSVTITELKDNTVELANSKLRAVLARDGTLVSLVHFATGRETMASAGNRIMLYDDRPTDFEAWDIDPFALETAQDASPADTCTITTRGPLRAELRFERRIAGASSMVQTVRLDAGSDHLAFNTVIDWRERRTMLKAVFPIAVQAQHATYETMYGAVERPTHANTDADAAQFEVPGHRWADYSEPDFGVSLLTDSRYGYSTFDGQMTLTLLRGTLSPDPKADIGEHRLSYALYPHAGDWRKAGTVAEAARFNRPLLWAQGTPPALQTSLVTSSDDRVVIDTIKPAEDGRGWIVRLYECTGNRANVQLSFGIAVSEIWMSNTLEDKLTKLHVSGNSCELHLRPYQVATLRIA